MPDLDDPQEPSQTYHALTLNMESYTPSALQSTPPSQPSTPPDESSTPSKPLVQPSTPIVLPSTPVSQPSTPITPPTTPFNQPIKTDEDSQDSSPELKRLINIRINCNSDTKESEDRCLGRRLDDRGSRRRLTRSSASSVPSAYSSTESEPEIVKKPIRRRRRRRKGSKDESSSVRKSDEIEKALLNRDIDKLGQLAVSPLGLLSDEMRVRVWPRLMGIDLIETDVTIPTDEEIKKHPEYNQVVMDVNRSLKRFPPGIGEEERPALQEQLTRLIIRVIMKHPHLHYYQGYHDVAITFLLVVGEELGFQIVERLSVSHLQEFMAPTMEETVSLLQFMYPLFRRRNPILYSHLMRAELGTIFALPWLITWFGHVLPDYGDVVRLYDFFLAQPPRMPIYLAAAIVLHREKEILATECEMSSIHGLLSQIPQDLPFEILLKEAQLLYEDIPPHTIQDEVRTGATKDENLNIVKSLATLIFYTAPVVLGVLAVRIYYSSA